MTEARGDRNGERADLTYPWWLVACLASGFVILAIVAWGSNTIDIDLNVSHWVQDRGAWAEPVARLGNTLGGALFAIVLLVVALALAVMQRRERVLWYLLVAAMGRVIAATLKGVFESPRPSASQVSLAEQFNNYGFPSGHATTSAIVLGSLAFLIALFVRDRRVRWIIVGFAVLGVCITAFARIYVGAHWFTDTVGGVVFGTLVVLVAANLSATIVTRRHRAGQSPEPSQNPAG